MPSLKQLNEVVMAWIAEHPTDLVTVVVDATFGHRIDPKEVRDFDEAVENNEIVAPPAGAIGRGDAFVLTIADKVKATVLSNDSYQEFHGEYEWLFDEGRLIGGKPVPHIGWVFVPRLPVRGPASRKSVRDAKRKQGDGAGRDHRGAKASKEASQPMPVPKLPPPAARPAAAATASAPSGRGRDRRGRDRGVPAEAVAVSGPPPEAPQAPEPARATSHHLNDLLSFLGFVEQHPVGTTLSATVESYSSHGAYVKIGDVVGYVPLRLMSDPPPRSARDEMAIGDTVTLVVAAFNPGRRGIDLGLPAMVPVVAVPPAPAKKRAAKKAAEPAVAAIEAPVAATASSASGVETMPSPAAGPKKRASKRAEAAVPEPAPSPEPATAKRAAKRAAKVGTAPAPAPASPTPGTSAPGKRSAAAKSTATSPVAATPEAPTTTPAAATTRRATKSSGTRKPAESAGGQSPGAKASREKASREKPSREKPAGAKPAGETSAGETSAGEKSAGEKSARSKSAAGTPAAGTPTPGESARPAPARRGARSAVVAAPEPPAAEAAAAAGHGRRRRRTTA